MKKIHLAEDTISRNELIALADWITKTSRLTKGPLCKEFEEKFANWLGVKYAVFVNSGSSANLLIAWVLKESGRLRNRRVIAPAVSWCTTVTPFIQLGYEVSLCDCSKDDLGLDTECLARLCSELKPAVLILVHVLGHPNKMNEIKEICSKYGTIIIEDSCEALGSIYKGKKCGSIGLAGSFSFYYGHHISTIEGGMLVTDDEELYNLMLAIRSHGWARDVENKYHDEWSSRYGSDEIRDLYTFYYSGFNLRSTDLNAFLGISQLNMIHKYTKRRQHNFELYASLLGDYWKQSSQCELLSNFAYATIVKNRIDVYRHLAKFNIESRPLICGNIGRHPFWIKKYGVKNLANADVIHDFGLYLPNHARLTDNQIRYIADVFREIAVPAFF